MGYLDSHRIAWSENAAVLFLSILLGNVSAYARLPDAHPEKTYQFLLGFVDRQLRTDREDYVYDMKEKSVENLLSSNKNAAPAEKKKGKGKGGGSGKEADPEDGNTAAPVLPKAKAKDHHKKGKGKGKGKSMSPEAKKEWPCVFHHTKEGGCLNGKDCPYSHNPKRKHKLDNEKGNGKGDGKAPRTDVEVVEPGSPEDKGAVDDVADLPHVSTGKAKDGIIYRNDLGKTVKLDVRGRPYPVGTDGFRTRKTTRPSRLKNGQHYGMRLMSMRKA